MATDEIQEEENYRESLSSNSGLNINLKLEAACQCRTDGLNATMQKGECCREVQHPARIDSMSLNSLQLALTTKILL